MIGLDEHAVEACVRLADDHMQWGGAIHVNRGLWWSVVCILQICHKSAISYIQTHAWRVRQHFSSSTRF